MWLMKVKESQQFQFFASYAIDKRQKTGIAGFPCRALTSQYLAEQAPNCMNIRHNYYVRLSVQIKCLS